MTGSDIEQKVKEYNSKANTSVKNFIYGMQFFTVFIPFMYLYLMDKQEEFESIKLLFEISLFFLFFKLMVCVLALVQKPNFDNEHFRKSTKMFLEKKYYLQDKKMFLHILFFNISFALIMFKFGGFYEKLSMVLVIVSVMMCNRQIKSYYQRLEIYKEFLK